MVFVFGTGTVARAADPTDGAALSSGMRLASSADVLSWVNRHWRLTPVVSNYTLNGIEVIVAIGSNNSGATTGEAIVFYKNNSNLLYPSSGGMFKLLIQTGTIEGSVRARLEGDTVIITHNDRIICSLPFLAADSKAGDRPSPFFGK
jgi:hypothetical protein